MFVAASLAAFPVYSATPDLLHSFASWQGARVLVRAFSRLVFASSIVNLFECGYDETGVEC